VDNPETAAVAVPGRTEPAPQESLSPTDLAALVSRGDQLLATRDIVNARLFYERAAASGNALGALRLGMSFDPGFVAQFGLQKTFGDPAQAITWYQRALGLGHPDAEGLLVRLQKH
jgi:TPR repeat protein